MSDQKRALLNIFEAIQVESIEILRKLLSTGTDVNTRNQYGVTALMQAASAHHQNGNIVQLLIAFGADINAQDENGKTALMYAAEQGHTAIVQKLLQSVANVNAKAQKVGVGSNRTALMYAAWLGHTETVKILIEAGACVNEQDSIGQTALSVAMEEEYIEIIDILVVAGAHLDISDTQQCLRSNATGNP